MRRPNRGLLIVYPGLHQNRVARRGPVDRGLNGLTWRNPVDGRLGRGGGRAQRLRAKY